MSRLTVKTDHRRVELTRCSMGICVVGIILDTFGKDGHVFLQITQLRVTHAQIVQDVLIPRIVSEKLLKQLPCTLKFVRLQEHQCVIEILHRLFIPQCF